ncbi:NUDIX domain-containing protein [Streptomyces sp. NPDC057638]|uniref:NUDIX hydrolase n=1 Tax=Streptomyces sp. NPDC057638 TaxID=3346190 RepID=UPI0036811AD6
MDNGTMAGAARTGPGTRAPERAVRAPSAPRVLGRGETDDSYAAEEADPQPGCGHGVRLRMRIRIRETRHRGRSGPPRVGGPTGILPSIHERDGGERGDVLLNLDTTTIAFNGPDNTGKSKHIGVLARRIGTGAHPTGPLHAHDRRWAAITSMGMSTWWFDRAPVEEVAVHWPTLHVDGGWILHQSIRPTNNRKAETSTVIERVRAILLTPHNTMLLIKRVRPGIPPYWVVPGGKVEPTDISLRDALRREIQEEIAGTPTIGRLFHTLENHGERQHFYLTVINTWAFENRTGPEFSEAGRGEYLLEEIALTPGSLGTLNLQPKEIASLLSRAIDAGDLFNLADAILPSNQPTLEPGDSASVSG